MSMSWDAPAERIVVFRARALGDMLCAVPALRALRAHHASASIALVGLPWARALAQRLDCVDEFIDFPGFPGVSPEPTDVRALPDFLAQVQARRNDLAVQMHGCDDTVNALVAAFGAERCAGFAPVDGWRPRDDADLFLPWPAHADAVEGLLALTDHLGMARRGTGLEFPLADADRDEARRLLAACRDQDPRAASAYVCLHPGAPRPSRRWDPHRYAAVADAIAARGRAIVLTGTASDAALGRDVAACMRHTPLDLSGRTSLWTLGALIEGAETLICGDAGVSRVATALGRPSVYVGA